MQASPTAVSDSTLSPSNWAQPGQRSALPDSKTLQAYSLHPVPLIPAQHEDDEQVNEPVVGLLANQRVMISSPSVLRHLQQRQAGDRLKYAFCQYVSPLVAHDGGLCDCFGDGWRQGR
jgi:hypothetical protein